METIYRHTIALTFAAVGIAALVAFAVTERARTTAGANQAARQRAQLTP